MRTPGDMRGDAVDLELGTVPTSTSQAQSTPLLASNVNSKPNSPPPTYQPSPDERALNAPEPCVIPSPKLQNSSPYPFNQTDNPETTPQNPDPTPYKAPLYNPNSETVGWRRNDNVGWTNRDYGQGTKERNTTCRNIVIALAVIHLVVAIIVVAVRVSRLNNGY